MWYHDSVGRICTSFRWSWRKFWRFRSVSFLGAFLVSIWWYVGIDFLTSHGSLNKNIDLRMCQVNVSIVETYLPLLYIGLDFHIEVFR